MYLLLFPLFAAIMLDRIQKLRLSIKKDDREAIRAEWLHVGLIVVVAAVLVLLIEVRTDY